MNKGIQDGETLPMVVPILPFYDVFCEDASTNMLGLGISRGCGRDGFN